MWADMTLDGWAGTAMGFYDYRLTAHGILGQNRTQGVVDICNRRILT